jgi:hypothetical protein
MSSKFFSYMAVLPVTVLIFSAGCRSETVNTVKVTGSITIDGKPIEQGAIKFLATDGATPVGGGTITNGTYVATVPPGKKKVLVNGSKVVGKEKLYTDMPDSPTRDKMEAVTPLAYNNKEATPLEADITGETSGLNFDLSSKFKSLKDKD